ncbi:ferredoxin [Streptomyces iranensis]|uniref:Ferredoxin n=1 Tax=Streptomyces iranensis TaxID=576784 RepID=A0A060ZGC3_9ACTN|nr:ferredoxin [Streptomyces iranensis]MBP2065953.1 ferredoxin [Streptomyces iranensis]CDR05028.1 ferredoxin [Streptomyces iranensis]
MKVWIDQSRCLNSRQCEETAPRVFSIADDSLAYVRQNGQLLDQPGGETCQANVPDEDQDAVDTAAYECPGQCIHVIEQP